MSKKHGQDPVESLVTRKSELLTYIQRVHRQEAFFSNVVKLQKSDITSWIQEDILAKRTEMYFSLGMSLSPLLSCSTNVFLKSCSQLLEEYEYQYSNFALQGMKYLRILTMDQDSLKKVGNTVFYEYLKLTPLPCKLDYFQVLHSLCDILIFVYRKFMEDPNPKESTRQMIYHIDEKIKSNFYGIIYKDLTAMSISLTKTKLSYLESTGKK